MPKYVIERESPGAGAMTPEQLKDVAINSNGVIDKMNSSVQWVESYVTDDKIYCVYIAPDVAAVEEHARLGEFPINRVEMVKSTIDPTSAE